MNYCIMLQIPLNIKLYRNYIQKKIGGGGLFFREGSALVGERKAEEKLISFTYDQVQSNFSIRMVTIERWHHYAKR
jgi:hypothetical protein